MIIVPAETSFPGGRLYRDSRDAHLLYLDDERPRPVKGRDYTQWLALPGESAYLSGEVRFASAESLPKSISLPAGSRLLPLPWSSGPVFAWYRQGQGVQLAARGQTSGFGASNVALSGQAPRTALAQPVMIAAELHCPAMLSAGTVQGEIDLNALKLALQRAAIGERAEWTDTLAAVLLRMLTEMETVMQLQLSVTVNGTAEATELFHLARLELARRIAAVQTPPLSLAQPAAAIATLSLPPDLDPRLGWRKGHTLPLRAVRNLPNAQPPRFAE